MVGGNPKVKLTTKVVNILRQSYAVASKLLSEGKLVAKPEVRAARISTCQGCPRYVDGTCSVCGCNLDVTAARNDLMQKTTYAASECPEGRWEE